MKPLGLLVHGPEVLDEGEVEEAVETLPDSLKAAFVLRDLEGLSTKEAAEVLDVSPSNLKVGLHRARLMLREQLAAYFEQPNGGGNEQ